MQRLFGIAVVVLMVGARGAAPADIAGLFQDAVLVRGQGVEIKRSQLDDAFVAYRANLASHGQSIPEEERFMREALLLDRLVITRLLAHRATEADRTTAQPQVEKKLIESQKDFSSPEAFQRRLKALGLTPAQFTNQVIEQALSQAVVDRELKAKIVITDEQVRDFYQTGTDLVVRTLQEELERLVKDPKSTAAQLSDLKKQIDETKKNNLARLEQPERVRVSHVLLATRDKKTEEPLNEEQKKIKRRQIEKIRTAALAGEDFSKLVQEFSEDRNVAQTKGEYTLSRNDPFVPEFKSAAFSLQPGQISDVVTTAFGYHILKLHEKIPIKKIEFEKVVSEIKDLLRDEAMQKEMPPYFEQLKKAAALEWIEPRYKIQAPKDNNPLKPTG
jgi:parvulin-like peptidyl-prolyl isomerase